MQFPNSHLILNPSSPTLRGLIKIHKVENPIRPIVNWKNAPEYKVSTYLLENWMTSFSYHMPSV